MMWIVAIAPKAVHLQGAPRIEVARNERAIVEARKRIDTKVPKMHESGTYTPFSLTEFFSDSAPNQYTLWGQSHRSLYRNGDTLCVAYRRVDSRGSGYIAVSYSFDGGTTWNTVEDVNELAGLLDAGGRYPNCVGFYDGDGDGVPDPVISWPELTSGPAWGYTCIASAAPSGPYGFCADAALSVYHTLAWPINPTTYAVIGFTTGDSIIFYTYDLSTAAASPVSLVRDSFMMYDIGLYHDKAVVYGYDLVAGVDKVIWIDSTGTVVDSVPVYYFAFATASDTISTIVDVSLSVDPLNIAWVAYTLQDTLNDPGAGIGHVIAIKQANDSTGSTTRFFYVPSPSNPDSAFRKNPVYRPAIAFHPTGYTILATALLFPDSSNYGCPTVTGSSSPPTELVAFGSMDGGATWDLVDPDLVGDGTPDAMEDLYLLSLSPGYGYTVYPGGSICAVYGTPLDGSTQLYCNAAEEGGVAATMVHVSCGQPTGLGIAEKTQDVSSPVAVTALKGGIEVSAPAVIYDAKGSFVTETKGGFVSLKRGVYFVKSGNRVSKVLVK